MTIWRVADVHPFMQWAKFQGEPMRSTVTRDFEQMMQSLDGELQVMVNNAVYTDYWAGSDALKSSLRDRPQKYTGRGAAARWLNHVNLSMSQVRACREFYQQYPGFRYRGCVVLDGSDTQLIAFLAVGALDHDIAFTLDPAGAHGRLNHIAFSVDTREDLLRAADILRDYGHDTIEFGPGRHAPGGSFFLYLREPGGNRIELYTGETLILAPDWQPIRWSASDDPLAYWGGVVPQSMYTYATPPVEMPQAGHSPAATGPGPQTAE